MRVDGAGVSRSAAVALTKPCTYRNSYTRCKNGWIYAPDGFGCVQSELCPVCDGEGVVLCQETLNDQIGSDTAGIAQKRIGTASNADAISKAGASRTASVKTAKKLTPTPAVLSAANTG